MANISKKYRSSGEYCTSEQREIIIDLLSRIYGLFTTDMLSWLAGLFDPNTGGFYYSNSGRDNDGFLPDIESTNQVLSILERTGAISSYDDIPLLLKREITFFVCQREDRESGFYFQPGCSYDNSLTHITRLARDLAAASSLADRLSVGRAGGGSMANALSLSGQGEILSHLSSPEALLSFLGGLPLNHETTSLLASQIGLIDSAGLKDTLCDFLISRQDPKTGLFGDADDRTSVSAFHGISWIFIASDRYLPGCDKAVAHILKQLSAPTMNTVYYASSCWRSLANIAGICRADKEVYGRVISEICASAEQPLINTYKALSSSLWDDGSFSYYPGGSCHISQGVPVALPGAREGDVNATLLAVDVLNSMYQATGLENVRTPIFKSGDFAHFINKIKIV